MEFDTSSGTKGGGQTKNEELFSLFFWQKQLQISFDISLQKYALLLFANP